MSNKIVRNNGNNNNKKGRDLKFGFKILRLADKSGKRMKVRELTWTDLAILHAIEGIKCPAFLSFIETPEHEFYAIFADAFKPEERDIYYAIKLGDYNAVAGSYISHDTEETAALWEKLMPAKDVDITKEDTNDDK